MRKTLLQLLTFVLCITGMQNLLLAQEQTPLNQVVNTLKERISLAGYAQLGYTYDDAAKPDNTFDIKRIIFMAHGKITPGAPQEGPVHSYRPGVTWTDLHDVLPGFVTTTLEQALPYFGRRIHGFDDDAVVMTGVETRTSAPVRIVRGEDRMALGAAGLYPIGEGAGYAGGIMSAFLDGLETAIEIIRKYQPLEVK